MQTARKITNEYISISDDIRRKVNRRKNGSDKVIYISDRLNKYNSRNNAYSYYEEVNGYGEIAVPMPGTHKKQKKRNFVSPEIERVEHAVKQKKQYASAQVAAHPAVSKGIVSTIMLIIAVFAILSIVITGNAKISELNIANAKIASEIETMEDSIEQTKLDISLNEDLNAIQERAAQLGMKAPAASQIVYVDGEKEDAAQVEIQNEASSESDGLSFDSVIRYIKNLLE